MERAVRVWWLLWGLCPVVCWWVCGLADWLVVWVCVKGTWCVWCDDNVVGPKDLEDSSAVTVEVVPRSPFGEDFLS